MSVKILCVDDEQNILDAYRRGLRKQFDIETALGSQEALEKIAGDGPYAVVVSDMQMPGMNGVQLLAAIRQQAPECVRMMLTGVADLETAIGAVNEGNIFRFLTKPCATEILAKALADGVQQYRLITAEKELLGKTLRGSINVLSEVLSLTNPTAFGHASRVRRLVGQLCEELKIKKSWECEVAAMLSQVGCVTIPTETLERFHERKTLLRAEAEMLESHPEVGRRLVANIQRMEGVATIIAYQLKSFDGAGTPRDSIAGENIPLGARILKVALDYDAAKWGGLGETDALLELRERRERYDPEVFAALQAVVGVAECSERRHCQLKELVPGMTLTEDVTTQEGTVVVAKGQEVSESLLERLKNFSRHRKLVEPIEVVVHSAVRTPAPVG